MGKEMKGWLQPQAAAKTSEDALSKMQEFVAETVYSHTLLPLALQLRCCSSSSSLSSGALLPGSVTGEDWR